MNDNGRPSSRARSVALFLLRKAVTLAVVGFVFGLLYDWALPWAFPPNRPVGFAHGMLHGAMMPIALPTLVMGKNVAIYDEDNSGRIYKIGYICGINLCGLVFFGLAFWRPNRPAPPTSTNFDKSQ